MKKKKSYVMPLFLSLLVLTGCGKKEDVITGLAYVANAYDMQYDYFNTEKTYQFELEEGDVLKMRIECSEGSLDLKVVDIDNVELYHEELLVSMTVELPADKAGRYIVVMTGKQTKGAVHMEVEPQKTDGDKESELENIEK